MNSMKICCRCKINKIIKEFHVYKSGVHKGIVYGCCKKCYRNNKKKYHKNNPWIRVHASIITRCKPNGVYGVKGRKYSITQEQVKELWLRDNAYDMNKPSIDRINNNKGYHFNNCRFIEQSENSIKDNIGVKNYHCLLTKNNIIDIRMEYSTGDTTLLKLANKYKVSKGNIYCIIKRKTWKHV